jgi:hypothetical protein
LVGTTGGRGIVVPLGIGQAAETKEPPGPRAQEVLASTEEVLAYIRRRMEQIDATRWIVPPPRFDVKPDWLSGQVN